MVNVIRKCAKCKQFVNMPNKSMIGNEISIDTCADCLKKLVVLIKNWLN